MNIGKQHISPNQTVRKGLQQLYGIGSYLSNQICDHLGFNTNYKIKNLSHSETESLIRILDKFYTFELKLQFEQKKNLQELIQIRSTRGIRRKAGLPCRGQRTKTNAKTATKFANR
jgi:small subunit ribosomal protein S13